MLSPTGPRTRLAFVAFLAATSAYAPVARAADAASDDTLEQIVVTGSRIPRASVEGPSPVTVIDGGDIDRLGFRNVFDALTSLTQNTGSVQGEDFGNTFTPAANVISLRGLGPNHSLVLVNGRRVADYPVAYGGSVNFVNLANIPTAMVERIEILDGGASAVYGSDAIAGVVNVILKRRVEGLDVSLRVGGTQGGGGENQRLQVVGGGAWGDLDVVYGLELLHRDPIFGTDRTFMDSLARNPDPDATILPTIVGYRTNASTGKYIDPGADACARLGALYDGTVTYANNTRNGHFCGSNRAPPTFWSVQTGKRNADAYTSLSYRLTPGTELFADLMLGVDHVRNNTRAPSWTSVGIYFYNQNTNTFEKWYRRFAPEELGGRERVNGRWFERSWNATLGARGDLGGSWHYEAAYTRSEFDDANTRRTFLNGLDEFFLGQKLGAKDGVPIYAPDPARLYTPLTPAEYDRLSGTYSSDNEAKTQTLSWSVNGDLLELPAGAVGFAAVVEAGDQSFADRPDPRLGNGTFWNTSAGIAASGTRDRYALGAEFKVPVFTSLTATAATRYDSYRYAGRSDDKTTWNLGLEYRPAEALLLRGTVATSFRAPDMNYIFAPETRGYFPGMTDYWRCRAARQDYDDCDWAGIPVNFTRSDGRSLKAENGRSWGYGLVWSPNASLDASIDYYHIEVRDEVTDLDADKVLRDEADCRLGRTLGGEPRDINSALCQDALRRVLRNPSNASVDPDAIQRVLTNPINAANEVTSGIDVKAHWRWDAGSVGEFRTGLDYTLVLTHDYRQEAGDPAQDWRNSLNVYDWRSKLAGTIGWSRGAWSASLYGLRYGSLPKSDGSGRTGPYMRYNASVSRTLGDAASIGLTINNLRNSKPPLDRNGGGWPFYSVGNYDPYGRQWWVEFDWRFGAGKK